MKALVVGCGSIAKRHIANLLARGDVEEISVYTDVEDCLQYFGRPEKLKKAAQLDVGADFAVVANETHKHIDTALLLARTGVNLFIEKPLSHNLEKVDLLRHAVEQAGIKAFVAYNLRFLGAIKQIKDLIRSRKVGDLYFAKIEAGQYLPTWRQGDYRQSYSASRARGGGVALDLSHEIDYMRYLFGEPREWKIVTSKVSRLEIDSEDMFDGIFKYADGFVCNVHLDYLQASKKREIRIVGSEGTIICDLAGRRLGVNDKAITDEDLFDVDKTYLDELDQFIGCLKSSDQAKITLEDGARALELIGADNVR